MPTSCQNIWLQVCVSSQHLPITVTRDEGDFGNLITRFKKAACGLVAQVVKAQVADPKLSTRAAKGSTNGATVIRKNAVIATRHLSLCQHQFDGIPTGIGHECDRLIITSFIAWMLSIYNDGDSTGGIDVLPTQTTDLVLAHPGRDRKPDNTADWNLLPRIALKMFQDAIKFGWGGPAIALMGFSNKPQTLQGYARVFNWLRRDWYAMDRGRVQEDHAQIAQFHSDGHGTRPFLGAALTKLDECHAIQVPQPDMA